jgi:ribokinase
MPHRQHAIVVLGDINIDILGLADSWPQPGDDCQSQKLELHLGGVAANCAFALGKWGIHPRLVGCVGQDEFGNFLRRLLRDHGVETHWIQTTASDVTGICYINVIPDGQRTFFGSRGASRIIRKPQRPHALFHRASALHLFGYNFIDPVTESTANYLLKSLRDRGAWVALDVGPEPSKTCPRKILQVARQVDILFANVAEAAALTLEREPRNAFRSLLNAGVPDVAMKMGKDGCLIFDEGTLKHVPPFAVRAVDSTGADDAFVAAFLQARLRGWSNTDAAVAANAAGAASACVLGAGENLPHLREIIRVLQTPFDLSGARSQENDYEWDSVRRSVLAKVQTLREPKPPRPSRPRTV